MNCTNPCPPACPNTGFLIILVLYILLAIIVGAFIC
jgi:hypothetical protein